MVAITTLPAISQPAISQPTVARPTVARAHLHPRLVVGPAPSLPRVGRSLVAAFLALVVVASVVHLVRSEPVPAAGEIPVLDTTHVAAEGDTMWAIANRVAPAGEAAAYVERLVAVNGTAAVRPGQVVTLPVP